MNCNPCFAFTPLAPRRAFYYPLHINYWKNPEIVKRFREKWRKMLDELPNQITGAYVEHDGQACLALHDYDRQCKPHDEAKALRDRGIKVPAVPVADMRAIAILYGTTVERMKEHWKCIKD